ncbi:uncharacterized protein LOC126776620 [Nymphalis io]|uniref:uncharacterized protein LOC126776620 n=1 Tax=Inachis io TaxID=171585 RepID=UPI002168269A|nr:uncharacterized protein LOC126776620 [Nymphalis io]
MKSLLVLAICFIAAQALTEEQKEKLKIYRSECLAVNTKVDVQLVNELKFGYFKTENEPLKKYILCILVKAGLMTEAGEFKKDIALAKTVNAAERLAVKKILDDCLTQKGNTPHQSAWKYSKCFHEKLPRNHESIFVNGQNPTTAPTNATAEPSEIYLEQCLNESKADRIAVNKLKSGDLRNANDALKKWTLCYLDKQGVMSSSGVLSQDTVLRNFANIDKDKVEQIIDKCLFKNAHDPVETAWHYITCFYKKGSKYAKKANRF